MKNFYIKQIFFAVVILAVIGFIYYKVGSAFTLEEIQENAGRLLSFVNTHYVLSVFIYCITFIVATVFSLPVTSVLTILSGYLFGIVNGVFYSVLSATIGGMIVFLLVRYFFGERIKKRFWKQSKKFTQKIKEEGYSYLLTVHLLPITPTQLINILAGLSPLTLTTFAVISFFGLIPGTLLFAAAGKELSRIKSVHDIISIPMFLLFVSLALLALLIPYAIKQFKLLRNNNHSSLT